jgi:HPt (histidine-containing phosphotransfer) domain-containing protein
MSTPQAPQTLVSQLLLEDADLRDIVEEFVNELGGRIDEINSAYAAFDWDALQTFAHRLKGAGGSYGYPDISALAATMEQHFRAQDASAFDDWIKQLQQLANAAQNGLDTTG